MPSVKKMTTFLAFLRADANAALALSMPLSARVPPSGFILFTLSLSVLTLFPSQTVSPCIICESSANFTMESWIFLSLSVILLFFFAVLSIKALTASLSALMRFVLSRSPMAQFILPEASSTSTTSSGFASVVVVDAWEDSADSATRKSAPSSLGTLMVSWSFRAIWFPSTVLSAQIRPVVALL